MKYSTQIKPISYLKAHASEMIRKLNEGGEPYIITQNGEAKAVVQSVEEFEQLQERLAFLQLVQIAEQQIEEGDHKQPEEVLESLRERIIRRNENASGEKK
ncbi:type II toxin-antitoxin system Phd/YefM family antitoxin [bacterium]|nr:type II toxin-antitoxin system Phd/YefM family antitoxin [bacterium]